MKRETHKILFFSYFRGTDFFFLPREKFISFKNITILIYQGVIFLIEYLKISFYERQRENVIIQTKLPDKSPMIPISGQYSGFDHFWFYHTL